MSLARVSLRSDRELNQQTYNKTPERKRMGFARFFFTALVTLFAAFMYYIAMHYVPALANPRKVVRLATETATLPVGAKEFDFEDASYFEKLLGPYYSLFALDRSYMRANESIRIKYELPEGATVELDILQCRRVWAVEVFNCSVIDKFTTKKKSGRGMANYALGGSGFYHFRHKVEGLKETDSYRLVWERAAPKSE